MAKRPAKHRQPWTKADEKLLKNLIGGNTPTRLMAHELKRTPGAVQQHANDLNLSTKPTNQSPYNRRKK